MTSWRVSGPTHYYYEQTPSNIQMQPSDLRFKDFTDAAKRAKKKALKGAQKALIYGKIAFLKGKMKFQKKILKDRISDIKKNGAEEEDDDEKRAAAIEKLTSAANLLAAAGIEARKKALAKLEKELDALNNVT